MRDDVEAICREVRALSAAHDVVITAGGLGEAQTLVLCRLPPPYVEQRAASSSLGGRRRLAAA